MSPEAVWGLDRLESRRPGLLNVHYSPGETRTYRLTSTHFVLLCNQVHCVAVPSFSKQDQ